MGGLRVEGEGSGKEGILCHVEFGRITSEVMIGKEVHEP
jgi:hypothetical protein